VGLKVNEDKTNDFAYLGCNISSKRDEMKEVQRRISNANKIYYHISAIIRSGNVQQN